MTLLTWVFLTQMRNESLVADDTKDSNFGNYLNADAAPNHAYEQPCKKHSSLMWTSFQHWTIQEESTEKKVAQNPPGSNSFPNGVRSMPVFLEISRVDAVFVHQGSL